MRKRSPGCYKKFLFSNFQVKHCTIHTSIIAMPKINELKFEMSQHDRFISLGVRRFSKVVKND